MVTLALLLRARRGQEPILLMIEWPLTRGAPGGQHVGTPSFLSQYTVTSSLPRPLEERMAFLPYYVFSCFSIDTEGEKPKMAVAGDETDGEAGGRGATGEPFTPGSLSPLCRSPVANRHILLWQLLGFHCERLGGRTQTWSAGDSWAQPPCHQLPGTLPTHCP